MSILGLEATRFLFWSPIIAHTFMWPCLLTVLKNRNTLFRWKTSLAGRRLENSFLETPPKTWCFQRTPFSCFFSYFWYCVIRTREQHEQKNTPEPLVLQPSSCEGPHRSQLQKQIHHQMVSELSIGRWVSIKMHHQICLVS